MRCPTCFQQMGELKGHHYICGCNSFYNEDSFQFCYTDITIYCMSAGGEITIVRNTSNGEKLLTRLPYQTFSIASEEIFHQQVAEFVSRIRDLIAFI
jgi:hypothetical protein